MTGKINVTLIFFLVLLLAGCKKDDDPIPEKSYKTIVELTQDYQVLKVTHYAGNRLDYTRRFDYGANTVTMKQTDSLGITVISSKFYLNNSGIADSCIDSSFNHAVLFNINRSIYTYDNNGYKTGADILATYVSSDTVASSLFTLAYTITEGNVNSMRVNGYSYASFTYATQVNKIDLVSFIGDYNGKINKNLRKSYHITAHSAPSTQPESSEYGYTINSEGLVIECEELFTPAYHVSTSDPAPERRITKYEYIFL